MATTKVRWENGVRVVDPQINAEGIHIYPFDASFPIDVRFFTLGNRTCVRMNRHHYFELMYVSSGKTVVHIQDRTFPVREGDLVVIGSDVYHRPVDPPDSHSRLIFLFFEPELIRGADSAGEEIEYLMPFLAQKSDFPHVIPAGRGLPAQALDLMRRIHAELPATTGNQRLEVRTYLKMILILLVKHYSAYMGTHEDFNRKRADLERLRPLFDYLEKHSHLPVQVEDGARVCAMSGSRFMSFFKRTTGQSFHCYLNQFRISKAQVLLTTTDKPLDSISQETGFCNQSYFGMMFRKLVGETPLAYRRRMGKGYDVGHVPMLSQPSKVQTLEEARGRTPPPWNARSAMSDTARIR
jgi:AraC-like DNA-binding protein